MNLHECCVNMQRVTRGQCLSWLYLDSADDTRGIPTGYLGLLEQRLQKTEEALYKTLSELNLLKSSGHSSDSGNFVSQELLRRDLNANKHARMEEWKEYPLEGPGAIEKWQRYMRRSEITSDGNFPLF